MKLLYETVVGFVVKKIVKYEGMPAINLLKCYFTFLDVVACDAV